MRVSVMGAGLMGRAIAAIVVRAGHDVSLYDSDEAALNQAREQLSSAAVDKDVCSRTNLSEAVAGAELVIEAICEQLEAKQVLFQHLDSLLPDAILATNTSVLPVTRIAAKTTRPARVVGTHWWNPPALIPVVEVVRGEHTSDATMDRAASFLHSLGKTPVRVERDVPGFIGNRLQHALWREAIALIADGVCDAETVDLMVRNTLGLRLGVMGPIENADFVGLDLTLAIHEALLPSLNREPHASALLRQLVAGGRLGAKTQGGFLNWSAGERERAAARLAAHVERQFSQPRREEHSRTGRG